MHAVWVSAAENYAVQIEQSVLVIAAECSKCPANTATESIGGRGGRGIRLQRQEQRAEICSKHESKGRGSLAIGRIAVRQETLRVLDELRTNDRESVAVGSEVSDATEHMEPRKGRVGLCQVSDT